MKNPTVWTMGEGGMHVVGKKSKVDEVFHILSHYLYQILCISCKVDPSVRSL